MHHKNLQDSGNRQYHVPECLEYVTQESVIKDDVKYLGRILIVADSGVANLEILLDGIASGTDVLLVDKGISLDEVFAHAFSGAYEKVHFLAHGAPGSITLAGRQVRAEDFLDNAPQGKTNLQTLHFWSCFTGSGSEGKAFVERISRAFGVGVTAFIGLVGAESLGGGWAPDLICGEPVSVRAPFSTAPEYPATLYAATGTVLSLDVRPTTDGQDVDIYLNAGNSIETATILLNYDVAHATFTPDKEGTGEFSYLNSLLAGVGDIQLVTSADTDLYQSHPGQILIYGVSTKAIGSASKAVLLATVRFTFKNGGTAVLPEIVALDTDLTYNDASVTLGTLPDLHSPTVVTFSPADEASNAVSSANIEITFSETIQKGSGLIEIHSGSATGTLVASYQAADSTNLTFSGSKLTINPTSDLTPGATYYVTLAAGSVRDVAGNSYAGTTTYNFSVPLVNDYAPAFTSKATGTVAENVATSTVIYKAVANDQDGNSLTYTLSGTDASLLNIDAATGDVTLKASANYESKSSYSFSVAAGDGVHTTTQAVTVSVTNVNEAPVITSESTGTVAENADPSTVVYTAIATDVDSADTMSFSLTGTDKDYFEINGSTGVVKLKASANFEAKATYSFNVVVTDSGNLTDTKAVTVTVTNVNEAPSSTADSMYVTVGKSRALKTTDFGTFSDPDAGDSLNAVKIKSLPSTGKLLFNGAEVNLASNDTFTAVDIAAGKLVYATVDSQQTGAADTLEFKVIDSGSLASASAYVLTFNIVDNQPPTLTAFSGVIGSVNEDTPATITFAELSAKGDEVDPDYEINSGTVEAFAVKSETSGTLKIGATAETATAFSSSTNYLIDSNHNAYWTPATNANGSSVNAFKVRAVDNNAAESESDVQVTMSVNAVNDAPVISSGSTGNVAENAETSTPVYIVAATNVDSGNGDTITYSLQSGGDASSFNIDSSTGAVTLKDPANYEGKASYSITVVATDSAGLTDSKAVTVNVMDVNEAPAVTSGARGTVAENAAISTVVYTAAASDVDSGDTVSYSLTGTDASSFNIDSSTGEVTLKDPANYEAKTSYSFEVVATDSGALTDSKAVTVSVTNVNEAPVFSSGATASVAENAATSTLVYTAAASDVDAGDSVTYSLTGTDASLFSINASTGAVTLKSSANYEAKATYSIGVVASDTSSLTTTKAVTVNVTNVNEAPSSTNSTVLIKSSSGLQTIGSDFGVFSDPDAGDTLAKIKVTSTNSHILYSLDGTWTPVANDQEFASSSLPLIKLSGATNATVRYEVADSHGLYSEVACQLTIWDESALYGASAEVTASAPVSDNGTTVFSVGSLDKGVTVTAKAEASGVSLGVTDLVKLYAGTVGLTDQTSYASVQQDIASHVSNSDHFRYVELADSGAAGNAVTIAGATSTHESLIIDTSSLHGTPVVMNNIDFAVLIGEAHITGGEGSNIVVADDSQQYIILGADDDTIYGGGGNDTIGSLTGNDVLYGDGGNDSVTGGDGNDSLYGGTGNDTLAGNAGSDVLHGGDGDNTIWGGDDLVANPSGSDSLTDTDMVVFDHTAAEYVLSGVNLTTHDATVKYYINGVVQQTDTLHGIEVLQFSNGKTIDFSAPSITSSAQTTLPVTSNIEISFSELINISDQTKIAVHQGSVTGSSVDSNVTVDGDKLVIDPLASLSNNTDYYVTFGAGAVSDYLGTGNTALTDETHAYHLKTVEQAAAVSSASSGGGGAEVAIIGGIAAAGLVYWLFV